MPAVNRRPAYQTVRSQKLCGSQTLFDNWDEETISLMENYLDSEMELITPQDDRDDVIALRDCLNKWKPVQKQGRHR